MNEFNEEQDFHQEQKIGHIVNRIIVYGYLASKEPTIRFHYFPKPGKIMVTMQNERSGKEC